MVKIPGEEMTDFCTCPVIHDFATHGFDECDQSSCARSSPPKFAKQQTEEAVDEGKPDFLSPAGNLVMVWVE
jgi:hypothetical protein